MIPIYPKYIRFDISYKLWLFFCKIKHRSFISRPISEQLRPSCVYELWDHGQTSRMLDRKWSSWACSEWAPFLLMSKLSWVSSEQGHRKRALALIKSGTVSTHTRLPPGYMLKSSLHFPMLKASCCLYCCCPHTELSLVLWLEGWLATHYGNTSFQIPEEMNKHEGAPGNGTPPFLCAFWAVSSQNMQEQLLVPTFRGSEHSHG